MSVRVQAIHNLSDALSNEGQHDRLSPQLGMLFQALMQTQAR